MNLHLPRIFALHASPGYLWVRVLDAGLHFKDLRRHPLMFSERYGYLRTLRLGHWSARWLPRERI